MNNDPKEQLTERALVFQDITTLIYRILNEGDLEQIKLANFLLELDKAYELMGLLEKIENLRR